MRSAKFLLATSTVLAAIAAHDQASAEDKCKVKVLVTAFIPDSRVENPSPVSIPPDLSHYAEFRGDGHANFVSGGGARVWSSVTVDLSAQDEPTIKDDTGTTVGYNLECVKFRDATGPIDWLFGGRYKMQEVATKSKATPKGASAVQSNAGGTATVKIKNAASDPLVTAAPQVNYDLTVTLTRQGNDVTYTVTGSMDTYPAYDIVIDHTPVHGTHPGLQTESSGKVFVPGVGMVSDPNYKASLTFGLLHSRPVNVSGTIVGACNNNEIDPKDPVAVPPAAPPAAAQSCPADPPETRAAYDPNDMSASPRGIDTAGFIRDPDLLSFLVRFENLPEALASAEDVVVTAQVDPAYDFDSIAALAEDTSRPDGVCIRLDPVTRTITWTFDDINLPPNVTSPEGQGFVRYSAKLAPGLTTGTELESQASIVFDANPPIATNTVLHTIDVTAPNAVVHGLPPVSSPTFVVSWDATDVGAGIDLTELYASESSGPWALVGRFPPGMEEYRFEGEPLKTYSFFARALDRVGNEEVYLELAEATTTTIADADLDGIADEDDNCPVDPNTDQADADGDTLGDPCDLCEGDAENDGDDDGICADVDNCPSVANADQANSDGDAFGDACDTPGGCEATDADGDGANACDDCNDGDAAVKPGAVEVCDGKDNDCDGQCDEGLGQAQVCTTVKRGVFGDVADADIGLNYASWAAGGYPFTWTGYSANLHRTLTRFETGFIPPGSSIVSATASWYASWAEHHETVRAHAILSPWSEATVTWNSFGGAGSFSSDVIGSFDWFGSGYKSVDIAAYLQAVVDGSLPDHGILLESDVDGFTANQYQVYYASEASLARRPQLAVCYVPSCGGGCAP